MTHLDIYNTSYGQKKGRESFSHFPTFVKNQIIELLTFHWQLLNTCSLIPDHGKSGIDLIPLRAGGVRRWKALDKGYNFG
jgi:hypothetical protein